MAEVGAVHVLLVALATQGHLNPMLMLGRHLASKGLQITLATTEIARQRILNANITTTNTNIKHPIHLEFFSDGLSLDFDRNSNLDHFLDQLDQHGPRNLSNLIHSLSHRRKFSCIINNPFVPWVADVAREHGIPCAMLWIQPCALYSLYYRFYKGLNRFPTLTDPNRVIHLPGLPFLRTQDLPSFILPSNHLGSIPKLLTSLFQNLDKLTWVLGNSFYELEKEAVHSMKEIQPFIPVGPLGMEDERDMGGVDMWKAEDSCIGWLDKQASSSVVYISFGSIVVLSSKQMENIAMGLKNSKRPFLWVVKPPEHEAVDGEGELPVGFVEETEGRGLVVQWCKQAKVLTHRSVACFVTHCGWNSTLETICAGVPVIAFPQWTDQPTNAKLLVDVFEMGVRLTRGEDGVVSQKEVERCIKEITQGTKSVELRKRALEWKNSARAAVSDGGSSDRNLQLFVDDILYRASESGSADEFTAEVSAL